MKGNVLAEIIEATAAECREDYVGLWEIIKDLTRAFPHADAAEIRKMSLEVVKELLSTDRAIAGDVSDEGHFVDWQLSVDKCIARIEEEWNRLRREPNLYEVVWLTAPWE